MIFIPFEDFGKNGFASKGKQEAGPLETQILKLANL